MLKHIYIILLLSFIPMSVDAQGHEVGGLIGGSWYFGDINPNITFDEIGYSTSVFYRRNFNNRISFKGGLSIAQIYGDDANSNEIFQETRNLNFKSSIVELYGDIELNFREYDHGSKDHYYTPYALIGASVFGFTPKTELNGETVILSDYNTEDTEYKLIQPSFKIGAGFKYSLNYRWSLNMEVSHRFLFTDYIDDVSGRYVDRGTILAQHGADAEILSDRSIEKFGEFLFQEGMQRGNELNNDQFTYFGIGLTYHFSSIRCFDKF